MSKKRNDLTPELENYFSSLEEEYGLTKGLLKSVAKAESGFRSDAVSPVGAKGMFQFMDPTAKEYGVDVKDPYSSATGAAKYLSTLNKMWNGDLDKVLASYNWGQGNVKRKGLENMPKETSSYLKKIKGNLQEFGNEEPIAQSQPVKQYQAIPENIQPMNNKISQPTEQPLPEQGYNGGYNPMAQTTQGYNGGYNPSRDLRPQSFKSLQEQLNESIAQAKPTLQAIQQQEQAQAQQVAQQQQVEQAQEPQQPLIPLEMLEGLNEAQKKVAMNVKTPEEAQFIISKIEAMRNKPQQPLIPLEMLEGLNEAQKQVAMNAKTPEEAQYIISKIEAMRNKPQEQYINNFNNNIDSMLQKKALLTYEKFNSMNDNEKAEFIYSLTPQERQVAEKYMSQFAQRQYDEKSTIGKVGYNLSKLGEGVADAIDKASTTGANLVHLYNRDKDALATEQNAARVNNYVENVNDKIDPSIAKTAGKIGTEIAMSMAPGIGAASSVAGKTAQYALGGAANSVIFGENEATDMEKYKKNLAQNAMVGGATGAVVGNVAEKALGAVAKTELAQKAMSKLGKGTDDSIVKQKQAEIKDLQEKGYDVIPADIYPEKFKNLEKNPYYINKIDGRNSAEKNLESRTNITNKFKDYGVDKNTTNRVSNVLKNRQDVAEHRVKEIEELSKKLVNSKEPADVVENSLKLNIATNKAEADMLYSKVEKSITESSNNIKLKLKNVEDTAIKIAKNKLESQVGSKEIPKELSTIIEDVSNGKKLSKNAKNIIRFEKELNDIIINSENKEVVKYARELKDSLTKDTKLYIEKSNNKDPIYKVLKAKDEADKLYREKVILPYENPTISQLVKGVNKSGDDKLSFHQDLKNILNKDNLQKLEATIPLLDETGKNALKNTVLNKFFNEFTDNKGVVNYDSVYKALKASPTVGDATKNLLDDNKNLANIIFTKQERKLLQDHFDIESKMTKAIKEGKLSDDDAKKAIGLIGGFIGGLFTPVTAVGKFAYNKTIQDGINKAAVNPKYLKHVHTLKELNPNSDNYVKELSRVLAIISGDTDISNKERDRSIKRMETEKDYKENKK